MSVGVIEQTWAVKVSSCRRRWLSSKSAFAGFRFPPDVIVVAVRWYLRFSLSYRDIGELLVIRGSPLPSPNSRERSDTRPEDGFKPPADLAPQQHQWWFLGLH